MARLFLQTLKYFSQCFTQFHFGKSFLHILLVSACLFSKSSTAQVGGNTCATALSNILTIGTPATAQTTCGKLNDDATHNGQDYLYCFIPPADGCVSLVLNFRPGDYTKNAEAVVTVRNACSGTIIAQKIKQITPTTAYTLGPVLDFPVVALTNYYITVDVNDYGFNYSDCIEFELQSSFTTPTSQTPGGATAASSGAVLATLGAPTVNHTTCCVGNNFFGTPTQNDWYYKYHADSSGCLLFAMNNMRTNIVGKTSSGILIVADAMAGNIPTSIISNLALSVPDGVSTALTSDTFSIKVQANKDYYFLVSSTSPNNASTSSCFYYDFQLINVFQNKPTLGGNTCAKAALAPLTFDSLYSNLNICCIDGFGATNDKWLFKLDNVTANCLTITQNAVPSLFSMSVYEGCPQGGAATLLFNNSSFFPVRSSYNFLGDPSKDYYVVIGANTLSDQTMCRPFSLELSTINLAGTQPGGPNQPWSDTATEIVADSLYTNQNTCCSDVWYYKLCPTTSGCARLNISNLNFTYAANNGLGDNFNYQINNTNPNTIFYSEQNLNYVPSNIIKPIYFDFEAGNCYYFRIEGKCMNFDFEITTLDTASINSVGGTAESNANLIPLILDSLYLQQTTCCVGDGYVVDKKSQDWYYSYCANTNECLTLDIFNVSGIGSGDFFTIDIQDGTNKPKFKIELLNDTLHAYTSKFDLDSGDCITIRCTYEGVAGCANFDLRLNYNGPPGNPIGGKWPTDACNTKIVLDSLYLNHTTCCGSDVPIVLGIGNDSVGQPLYDTIRAQEWKYCYCATSYECLRLDMFNLTGMAQGDQFEVRFADQTSTVIKKIIGTFQNQTTISSNLFYIDSGDCIVLTFKHISKKSCVNFDFKLSYNGTAYQVPGGATLAIAQNLPAQLNTPYYHTTCCYDLFNYVVTSNAKGCLKIQLDSIITGNGINGLMGIEVLDTTQSAEYSTNSIVYNSNYKQLTTSVQVDSGVSTTFLISGSCANYKLTLSLDTFVNTNTVGSTDTISYANTPLYPMQVDSLYLNQGGCCNSGFRSYAIIAPSEGCIIPQVLNLLNTHPLGSNIYPAPFDTIRFAEKIIYENIMVPNITFDTIAVDSAIWYPNYFSFDYTNRGCTQFDILAQFLPIQTPGSYTAAKAVNKPITLGQQYALQTNCHACKNGTYNGLNSCDGFYGGTDWIYYIKPQTTGTIKVTLNDIIRTDSKQTKYITIAVYNAAPGTPSAQVASKSKVTFSGVTTVDSLSVLFFAQANTDSFYIVVDVQESGVCLKYKIRTEKISSPLPCNNSDFETGNLTGWVPSFGYSVQGCNVCACPAPYYTCPTFSADTNRHKIVTSGTDYYGGFPKVFNGLHSLQLGNSSTGAQAEGIKRSFIVTPSNSYFEYSYAVVFQDPGHQPQSQPFFRARLKDSANNIIQCTQFCISATGTIPGFIPTTQPSGVNVFYKPWSTIGLDLTPYIGTVVTAEFENGDCADGGHFGYSYIDCICAPSPTTTSDTICAGLCDSLFGPQGYASYNWQPGGFTTANIKVCPTTTTTYTLNFTTFTGCAGQLEYLVVVPNAFTITDSVNCLNGGTIQIFADSVINNNLIYSWSNTSFTNAPIVTGVSNGTYTVSATDGFCFTVTDTVTLNFMYPVINNTSSSNVLCNGQANGTININATCNGGCTYLLNNTAVMGTSFTGLDSGVYLLQIIDSIGCTINITTVITEPNPLLVNVVGWSSCDSSALIAVTTTVNGGTLPYTYLWSGGSTNSNPLLPIGPATILITDTNGCTATDTFINTAQGVKLGTINASICQGASFLGYNSSGTFTDTFTLSNTCDSVRILNLVVNPTFYDTTKVTICAGTTYQGQTTSGTYTSTYLTTKGCDSLKVLVLNVIPFIVNNITQTICAGDTFLGYTTSGIYTDTFISFATGCDSVRTINLNVIPIQNLAASVLPNNLNICQGTAITLSGSGATNYTWSNGVVNNTLFTPTATNTYTVTGTSGICSSTATITINVLTVPTVSATALPNPAVVCAGDSVKLIATSTSPVAWSNGINNNVAFNSTTSNVYTVTATASNGCTSISTVSITVNALPVVAITANPSSNICIGNNVSLSASGATNYVWSSGIVANTPFAPSTTTTYTVTATNSNNCTKTATQTIAVNPLPTISAVVNPSTGIICAGQLITLSGSGANTYLWSGGITNNTPFIANATATYTVIGTDANGCTNSTTTSIVVLPTPIISIASVPTPATICQVDSIKLIATGASSYNWSNGVSNDIYFNPTSSATYTVTATATNGCTVTNTQVIQVNPLPSITISANPSFTICAGKSVVLTASAGANYVWSSGISNAVAFTPTGTNTYTVTATSALGCTNTSTAALTVNALPAVVANSLPNPAAVCSGLPITLYGSGALNYTWTNGITNNVAFNLSANNTYTVIGTDANGCSNTASINATANPIPIINISAMPSTNKICQYDSINLLASGASTYVWSNGMANGTFIYPSVSTTYTVTGTSAFGCSNTQSISVTVIPVTTTVDTVQLCEGVIVFFENVLIPAAGTYTVRLNSSTSCDSIVILTAIGHIQPIGKIDGNTDVCIGDTFTLKASTFEAGTIYSWSLPSATVHSQTDNAVSISYNAVGDYEIALAITPIAPCVPRMAFDTVHVHDVNAKITSSSLEASVCNGSAVTLASYYNENYTYKWLLGSELYDTTRQVLIKPIGETLVVLQVQDQYECKDEDSIVLRGEVCCTLSIPNAFTPNDDKVNDAIHPILDYSIALKEFSVFNRWGEKVFTTMQKELKWDGTYKGVPCDVDTYFYVLRYECKGESKVEKGEFQLIR
jgi:gliding motility-associated-like protein